MTTETWLPVVGYEGLYEVSDLGRVRSAHGRSGWRVLKSFNWENYRGAVLCKAGRQRQRRVHHLVAEAFIGPRPPGHDCCHNDGNGSNNALINLRWDTRAGNLADRVEHGTDQRGERHPSAKLTESQVLAIRADPRLQREIAADYGVVRSVIAMIKNRHRWTHI
jgi:hypothetical protein